MVQLCSKYFAPVIRSLIKPNKRAPKRLNFFTLEMFCIIDPLIAVFPKGDQNKWTRFSVDSQLAEGAEIRLFLYHSYFVAKISDWDSSMETFKLKLCQFCFFSAHLTSLYHLPLINCCMTTNSKTEFKKKSYQWLMTIALFLYTG